MPRAAWAACYQSRVSTLIGGFTMAGTNVFYNGSVQEFSIAQGCVCDCSATADGVVCSGTDGMHAFSLLAYVPEFQLAIAEMGDLGMLVFRGRQRSINIEAGGGMNIFYRADLEWPLDLKSEHLVIGEGALYRTEAAEIVQWRARQSSSNCSLAAACGAQLQHCMLVWDTHTLTHIHARAHTHTLDTCCKI